MRLRAASPRSNARRRLGICVCNAVSAARCLRSDRVTSWAAEGEYGQQRKTEPKTVYTGNVWFQRNNVLLIYCFIYPFAVSLAFPQPLTRIRNLCANSFFVLYACKTRRRTVSRARQRGQLPKFFKPCVCDIFIYTLTGDGGLTQGWREPMASKKKLLEFITMLYR